MRLKFYGEPEGQLQTKKVKLPSVTYTQKCPKCGHEEKDFFNDRSLHNPVVNKPFDYYCLCISCDYEWKETVVLKLTIEVM